MTSWDLVRGQPKRPLTAQAAAAAEAALLPMPLPRGRPCKGSQGMGEDWVIIEGVWTGNKALCVGSGAGQEHAECMRRVPVLHSGAQLHNALLLDPKQN